MGKQTSAQDPLALRSHTRTTTFGETPPATDPMAIPPARYDDLGDPTKVTTPDARLPRTPTITLGELTATADADGDASSFSLQLRGLPTVSTNPDGSYTQDGYDEAGT